MLDMNQSCLDKETGEIYPCIFTNVETGEIERYLLRKKPFQVPRYLMDQQKTREEKKHHGLSDNMVAGTSNVNPVVFMLPTFFLFPAWASILCLICEACVHIWSHRRCKTKWREYSSYKSPLHLITSEFCAHCQSEKRMQKIGKIQDERTMRRKVVSTDYIRRVVT